MATGASNLSGERIPLFDLFGVPKSSNIKEGYVVVFTSDSGDNKIVDVPTAATALLGGRAFAGVSCDQGTTTAYTSTAPPGDNQIQVAVKGVAKCALKASTACVRGGEAAYDPIDGGPVVPYTSANQVKIGRFTQSKSSSASEQFVGVELDMGSDFSQALVGAVVASSSTLQADAETAFDQSVTIKANRLKVGSVITIQAGCRVTDGASADTLILRLRLGGLTGGLIAATSATNVVTGDIWAVSAVVTIRSATTATFTGWVSNIAAAGTAAPLTIKSAGTLTIPTITAALDVVCTADWSGATTDDVILEDLVVLVSN